MRKFLAIFIKDTLLRFTSPLEWLFFLILPVVFTLAIGGGTGAPADNRVRLYVVDEAMTTLSADLIDTLQNSTAVQPILKEKTDALADLDARKVSSVLLLPAGFTYDSLESGASQVELRVLPNSTNGLVAQQGVQAAISHVGSSMQIANASVQQAESLKPFTSALGRQAYFTAALSAAQEQLSSTPVRIRDSKGSTPDQIEYDPRANSAIGQMLTWVFIPLIGLSAMFALERQLGTLKRVLTTPTTKATYLGGTVLGQLITALVQMGLLILFSIFVMKLNWGNSPLAVLMILVSSILAAASLGVMLGTLVKSEGQANGLSIMVGMVMAMMGGCWYPIELFPLAIRTAVKVLPTTWAMQGLLDIVVRGQGVSGVWLESVVLLGFALLFFVIGVWRFKYE